MNLITKLIAGIILGLLMGLVGPDWLISITETGRLFLGDLIKFFVPLIILAFIAGGIAELEGRIGRMLTFTVALSYLDTIIAISLAVIAALLVIPLLGTSGTGKEAMAIAEPFMEFEIDTIMGVLSALVLAFVIGIGSNTGRIPNIRKLALEFRDIILLCIKKVIIPILPFFIACIFARLAARGEILSNIAIFAGMFALILVVQWVWLAIEYSIAGAVYKKNPLTMIKQMLPAYLTGLGTMSSAATMPVALEQSKKVHYMDKKICDFAIPLCNTVHQACAAIGIAIGAITVSLLTTGALPPISALISFIILLGVIEVGAVGVPGGSIMAAIGILESTLGFGDTAIGLMITLFAIQDGFAAAGNVTGDGAIAMVVNRLFGDDPTTAAQPASHSTQSPAYKASY